MRAFLLILTALVGHNQRHAVTPLTITVLYPTRPS